MHRWGDPGAKGSNLSLKAHPPVKAKALESAMVPTFFGLPGFAPEGHSRAPQHGAGWEAPRLGFAASGASRARAYVPPQPGGAGGGPIRAPSQNLPLPLVTATSLLCLASVQPPHTCPLLEAARPRPLNLPGLCDSDWGQPSPGLSFLIWQLEGLVLCTFSPCPSGVLGPPSNMPSLPGFLPFNTTPGAKRRCHLGARCSLSQPRFLIHKVGVTRILQNSHFANSSQADFRTVPSSTPSPTSFPLVLSLSGFFFFFFSVFDLAGPFSSLRHHLAHHSGRPRRPGLAPAVCQGVPAEGRSRTKW